jgi:hypothetical protein
MVSFANAQGAIASSRSVDRFNCAHLWREKLTTPAAYFQHGENHRFVDRRSNPDLRGDLRAIGWEFP